MWQKERLLNLCFSQLPDTCDYIAWLDCDVVLKDDTWPDETKRRLENYALVQVFQDTTEITNSANSISEFKNTCGRGDRVALCEMMHLKVIDSGVFSSCGPSLIYGYAPGFGWATKRETIAECGLYDSMILGSGDKVIAAAAYGELEKICCAFQFTESQADHYHSWGSRFFAQVKGELGSVPCSLGHLRHGQLEQRYYASRYRRLSRLGFYPSNDLRLTAQGCWEWASSRPELRLCVEQYLEHRGKNG